jgi:hypothetical protein
MPDRRMRWDCWTLGWRYYWQGWWGLDNWGITVALKISSVGCNTRCWEEQVHLFAEETAFASAGHSAPCDLLLTEATRRWQTKESWRTLGFNLPPGVRLTRLPNLNWKWLTMTQGAIRNIPCETKSSPKTGLHSIFASGREEFHALLIA